MNVLHDLALDMRFNLHEQKVSCFQNCMFRMQFFHATNLLYHMQEAACDYCDKSQLDCAGIHLRC